MKAIWEEDFRLMRLFKVEAALQRSRKRSGCFRKALQQISQGCFEGNLKDENDFIKYDGLHANLKTKHQSDEEVQYILLKMNARYYVLGGAPKSAALLSFISLL